MALTTFGEQELVARSDYNPLKFGGQNLTVAAGDVGRSVILAYHFKAPYRSRLKSMGYRNSIGGSGACAIAIFSEKAYETYKAIVATDRAEMFVPANLDLGYLIWQSYVDTNESITIELSRLEDRSFNKSYWILMLNPATATNANYYCQGFAKVEAEPPSMRQPPF
jgi:hypothetical protein